jgi:ethanolamine-phosphate cytidylyltransferase
MGNHLCVGVNSDADLTRVKGPTIMNGVERSEILKHCKFVENIILDTAYTPTKEFLDEIGCGFYAHGDDPAIDSNGIDITLKLREQGMFKLFKRTEGVSTTDITGKLLALAE